MKKNVNINYGVQIEISSLKKFQILEVDLYGGYKNANLYCRDVKKRCSI